MYFVPGIGLVLDQLLQTVNQIILYSAFFTAGWLCLHPYTMPGWEWGLFSMSRGLLCLKVLPPYLPMLLLGDLLISWAQRLCISLF